MRHSLWGTTARLRPTGWAVALVVATVAMLAAMLAMAPAVSAQPDACSVSNADGGIDVSWATDAEATTYVYRLEVAGENNRYARVNDTQTFIELVEGQTATVFVSAVYADGSYSASASCGSGQANDGTGGGPGNGAQTCSVSDGNGGVDVSWSAVSDATEYVYRLEVAGNANRYKRVSGLETFIPLNAGTTGTVWVSAVLANGTYSPSASCGSGSPADGTGGTTPTCSLANTVDGTFASWSSVPGSVRYVYRIDQDGSSPRYRVSTELQGLVDGAPGSTVSVAVSGQLVNGTYTGAIQCGTITLGGGGGGIDAPASCISTPIAANADQSGAEISWDSVNGAAGYVVISRAYRAVPDVENSVGPNESSFFLPIPLWWSTEVSVVAVDSDGSRSDATSCGQARPGQPLGPASCISSANGSSTIVDWDAVPQTGNYVVGWFEGGGPQQFAAVGSNSLQYSIPVGNVENVSVTANVISSGPGGAVTVLSTSTACDDGGNSGIAAPASCGSNPVKANADESGADIDWQAVPGAAGYVVISRAYRAAPDVENSVGPNESSFFLPISLWWETQVSVVAVDSDGNRSAATSCGLAEPGQPLGPASCTLSNGVASWDPVVQAANYVVYWYVNGVEAQQGMGGSTTEFTLPAGADTVRIVANVVAGGPGGATTYLSDSRLCTDINPTP